jgi:hypothetical protein
MAAFYVHATNHATTIHYSRPDPSFTKEWCTEQGIDSSGEVYTIRYKRKSPTVAEGEYTGTLAGKESTGKARIERPGPDEFTVRVTEANAGDDRRPDWVLRYSRVTKQRKRKTEK